jgi:hypothetical protein
MKILVLILGGGQAERLGALSAGRGIPTVPFGGKYRLIDFPLSNAANSSLERIAVLVQYHADMLVDYLGDGAPWRLPGQALEIETWQAGIERTGFKYYTGSADALYQNRRFIRQSAFGAQPRAQYHPQVGQPGSRLYLSFSGFLVGDTHPRRLLPGEYSVARPGAGQFASSTQRYSHSCDRAA